MLWIFGALGWMAGVAVNELADALPGRERIGVPRCRDCGGPRDRYAWSALLGWLLGHERCRYCGSGRGRRSALIEAGLAISFIALASSRPPVETLVDGAVVTVFTLIAVIDLEHKLILHVVSLPAAAVMAAIGILDPSRGASKTLLGGLVGAGVVGVMYLGGIVFSRALARIRGRRLEEVVFGFGDVTLAALIGLTVGWPGIILALLLGVFAAGAYALVYLGGSLLRRQYVAFRAIPYGPFLILGALAVYLGWVTSLAQAGGAG